MFHHTFNQDPSKSLPFTMSEVCKDGLIFPDYLANVSVIEYLDKHVPLVKVFIVEVYGTNVTESRRSLN